MCLYNPLSAQIDNNIHLENCSAPSSLSGYELVKRIRDVAHGFGTVKLLKAYTELSEQSTNSSRSTALRSELQSSGVSIIDCPHTGYKNVADQMIIGLFCSVSCCSSLTPLFQRTCSHLRWIIQPIPLIRRFFLYLGTGIFHIRYLCCD